jgi:hypothetical protein
MTTRIETEDVELLPCPFCGLHLREDGTEWHHEIADCPLADCVFDEQQIAEWNTRAATPIERLREENARRGEALRLMPDEIEVFRIMRAIGGSRGDMAKAVGRRIDQIRAALTPSADDDK